MPSVSKRTYDLFNRMTASCIDLREVAENASDELDQAQYHFDLLSDETEFENMAGQIDELSVSALNDYVNSASESTRTFLKDMAAFDETLAKIIHQRGQLAEQLGVPMFSHLTGGKQWERFDHEYTM
jgi:hypothetical protein